VWSSPRPDAEQDSTPPDARIAARAAQQHGQVSTRQLRALGLSDDAIAGRVRSGRLHRRHRGVYSVGHEVQTLAARFMAAVLACGRGAVLSHHSAAAHLRLRRWQPRRPEVTVPAFRRINPPGIVVHRSRNLDHRRDVLRHDGIWVTSPARTILDLAATLPPRALRRMVRQAQVEHRVTIRQLLELLGRANGHPGASVLRAAIADGATPTRSELEDIVLDLIDQVTSERPAINVPLWLDGERQVPDFRWPDRRLVIEADGAAFHDHATVRAGDAHKQAQLEAHGDRVLRITWDEAVRRPVHARHRIAGALAQTRPQTSR
jgi:hypothetical protein